MGKDNLWIFAVAIVATILLLQATVKPRIDSHHGGTWDSPVGKPRGKAWLGKPRGKATDPLIHANGSAQE